MVKFLNDYSYIIRLQNYNFISFKSLRAYKERRIKNHGEKYGK